VHFFDSHAHASQWRSARSELRRIHLERAHQTGVRAISLASAEPADWPALISQNDNYGIELYYCIGVHPYALGAITPAEDEDHLAALREQLERADPRLRAIGECGLDFRASAPCTDRERQQTVLRAHVELARETGLPLVLHCVSATGPLYELLSERPIPPSVLHSYSGSPEMAHRFAALGHYISFSGSVTRPGAKRVAAAARAIPKDRILIETDAPDQTPEGRGAVPCEPAFVVDVARRIATLRSTTLEQIAAQTFDNACRVYGVAVRVAG
jgi:TatD DNase family protein